MLLYPSTSTGVLHYNGGGAGSSKNLFCFHPPFQIDDYRMVASLSNMARPLRYEEAGGNYFKIVADYIHLIH